MITLSAMEKGFLKDALDILSSLKTMYEDEVANSTAEEANEFFDIINPNGNIEEVLKDLDKLREHFLGEEYVAAVVQTEVAEPEVVKDESNIRVDKVENLLEFLGVPEENVEAVYSKLYYWDFIISLSESLNSYGSLTVKQIEAAKKLILKHTDVVCDDGIIVHEAQYERSGTTETTSAKQVDHNFDSLNTIQVYDLPFDTNKEYTLEFHPYNTHSVVVRIKGAWYKIPFPSNFPKLMKPTMIKFSYKRTSLKGFMRMLPE